MHINSFNGATTFQPWKYCCQNRETKRDFASMGPRLFSRGNRRSTPAHRTRARQLQWGHDFSAVEITHTGAPAVSPISLQWGHDFSAVEIKIIDCLLPTTFSSFNGATTFQPWKFPKSFSGDFRYKCFNGATTFQPWKWKGLVGHIGQVIALQWGHDFSAVEMRFPSMS